ncbi:GreA/GreB family elongation factor [Oligoflexus tunisiensis]|uniref:GreA/GreB family elongation factor n=1 Tax=Oligoflexus tunisiensis TaxID=708132 RepID=UPI000A864336|nr:transcription elongation factor GreA [Oligoflexus tunisiensis]
MKPEEMKNPLTREGWQRIAEEHRQLLEVERPRIVENMATAAAEGDRSENAEYIYSRKRMREIDKRLRYLTGLLKDAQIIDPRNIRSDRIEFGATFVIEDEEGQTREWTIVGVGESDADQGTISWKSPLARAVWGKKVGQVVTVHRPVGDADYEIIDIHYAGRRVE